MKPGEAPVLLLAELADHSILTGLTAIYGGTPMVFGDVVGAELANSDDALAFAITLRETVADDASGTLPQPRIALHVGAVDRGIHLLAIGHPGQILLSRSFHDLLEADLPPGTWLEDLGWHGLADHIQQPATLDVHKQ
ncbi:MAG: hypothetical protein M3O70_07230 [Actinomycetota bacterium]|nr:hypothetical protein [Actinomycetota bacterium]